MCENHKRCARCGERLYRRRLNANYFDGHVWHVPGFCALSHRCGETPDREERRVEIVAADRSTASLALPVADRLATARLTERRVRQAGIDAAYAALARSVARASGEGDGR